METENVESTVTTRSVGLRYGFIMAVIAIFYFVALDVAGVDMTQGFGRWASILFYVGIIVLAQKHYKDNGSGFMSYGEGLGISFWISLITSVVSSIFTFVYIKFIDSGFLEKIMDQQRAAMEDQGLSEDQIDQAMKMAARFTTPEMMLVFGILGGVFMIMVVGLIVTIFTQKKNPDMPV
jgi:Protein of unknown function (DUF4199)